MANPTNKGVGTGTAVVTDFSGLNEATARFFQGINRDRDAKRLRDEKEAEKKRKAEDELMGKLGDFDPSNMREADKPMALEMWTAIQNKYRGKYDQMINGDPALMNAYNTDVANAKIAISNSIESKKGLQDHYKAVMAPDSGYSPELQKKVSEYSKMPGATMDGLKEYGLYAPDTIVGDYFKRLDNLFISENALYDISEGSYTNQKGQNVKYDKKNWHKDAQEKFNITINSNPRALSDLDIKYRGLKNEKGEYLSQEEKLQKLYDEYRKSREESKDDYFVGAPKTTSTRDIDGVRGKFNFSYQSGAVSEVEVRKKITDLLGQKKKDETEEEYRARAEKVRDQVFSEAPGDVITLGRGSGASPSPVTINGKTGIVSEIIRPYKGGKWMVIRTLTKDDYGSGKAAGENIIEPVGKTMKSHLESTFGIKDLDALAAELGGKGSSSGTSTQGSYTGSTTMVGGEIQ